MAGSVPRMTLPWNDQLLVRVDDDYDREYASNGDSRFNAYLKQNPELFRDGWSDEPAPVKNPAEFAVHAWQVATGPVMAPGYVQWRPDLHDVHLHRSEDDGALYASVRVPLRHAQVGGGIKRFPYTWQDWEEDRGWGIGAASHPTLQAPESGKRTAVLASVEVQVSGHEWTGLVTPTAYEGRALLEEAQRTLAVLVEQINADAGPIVRMLLE